jgi:hypothetical protein
VVPNLFRIYDISFNNYVVDQSLPLWFNGTVDSKFAGLDKAGYLAGRPRATGILMKRG